MKMFKKIGKKKRAVCGVVTAVALGASNSMAEEVVPTDIAGLFTNVQTSLTGLNTSILAVGGVIVTIAIALAGISIVKRVIHKA